MAFKMKGFSGFKLEEDKKFKSRSSDVMAKEGEYKGQMVDPRTGMPKGVSKPPSDMEATNKDKIDALRIKMKNAEPFSDEAENIRQQILKLRGK
tara:strand:- start:204 stop:485 length:282 start_codon:yes stop_codon:yes gene_type:complete